MTEEKTKVETMFKFLDTTTPGPWLLYSDQNETKFYIMQQSPIGLTTVCSVERRKDAEAIIILRNGVGHHKLMSAIHEESNRFMVDKMYIQSNKEVALVCIFIFCINFPTLFYNYPWYLLTFNVVFSYFLINIVIHKKSVQYFNTMSDFVSNFKQQ